MPINDKLKALQDLAQQLGQCQKSLKEGDSQSTDESLAAAADKLKQMDGDEQNLEDMREQLARLQDAKDSC